jgi:hypothetical protein
MKVTSVLRAQATDALKPNFFSTVQVFELVEALQSEYNFRQIPSNQELLNPPDNKAATFIWSKKEIDRRVITIDSLQVQNFPNLTTIVGVTTRSSTDDAEAVLKHLAQWIETTFRLEATPLFPRSFQSQLELELNADIFGRFTAIDSIGKMIGEIVRSYGFTGSQNFLLSGITLNFDTSKITSPPTLAVPFTFERRANFAFDSKRCYSQAPLKTGDHEETLRLIEEILG